MTKFGKVNTCTVEREKRRKRVEFESWIQAQRRVSKYKNNTWMQTSASIQRLDPFLCYSKYKNLWIELFFIIKQLQESDHFSI